MLKKIHFNINIEAPAQKVWDVLWQDKTYRAWTSTFGEGSHAISDWKEGSKILFLGGNGDGGMYSRIHTLVPNKTMIFEHLGIVKDGVEQPQDEQTKAWAGAKESYFLEENNNTTTLKVALDTDAEYEDYFGKSFPLALQKVKELSEQ